MHVREILCSEKEVSDHRREPWIKLTLVKKGKVKETREWEWIYI